MFTSLLVEDKFSGALAKENNNNNNKKTKRLRKERLRLPSINFTASLLGLFWAFGMRWGKALQGLGVN